MVNTMNVAVVYWSGTGNTEAMANAVSDGAKEAGAQVKLFSASEFNSSMVNDFDGIAFGCPSMGVEELEDGEFLPMFEDVKGSLGGKKVALFGSYGWGDGEWMRTWQADCEAAGIALVANGLIANEAPDDEAIESCKALGKALA